MLSRSAQGLYWMGRYLERARHLSRLLQLQTEALVDRPIREIYFGWRRIYNSLGRTPPGGALTYDFEDDFVLADSYTLADDLTFEHTNPGSVWRCFWMGRENARQMRNSISGQMWTSLNKSYLRIQKMTLPQFWQESPPEFYAETIADIDRFVGVAQTTMYRDDGWRFMQLGGAIERAQLMVALLRAHLASQADSGEVWDDDWTSLLRICNALDAYGHHHGLEMQAFVALDLLVADPYLPGSLFSSVERTSEELAGLGPAPHAASAEATRRQAGRLGALVNYEWPDSQDSAEFLDRVWGHCLGLHDAVSDTYFHYQVS